MVCFKLCIHDVGKRGKIADLRDHAPWAERPAKRAIRVIIRAYIYQCRDLPAADSNGTSDPFVKVWDMSGKQKKTSVVEDNNNPTYYETLELEYEVRDIKDRKCYPPFILDVFDSDAENLLDRSDDYLARAVIDPATLGDSLEVSEDYARSDRECDCDQKLRYSKCLTCRHTWEVPGQRKVKGQEPGKPRWHPLRYAEGQPPSGEILLSFAVSELDYRWKFPAEHVDLRSNIKYEECDFGIQILGLRGLQSPGTLPVKKAFIQFNIRSLVPARL